MHIPPTAGVLPGAPGPGVDVLVYQQTADRQGKRSKAKLAPFDSVRVKLDGLGAVGN